MSKRGSSEAFFGAEKGERKQVKPRKRGPRPKTARQLLVDKLRARKKVISAEMKSINRDLKSLRALGRAAKKPLPVPPYRMIEL